MAETTVLLCVPCRMAGGTESALAPVLLVCLSSTITADRQCTSSECVRKWHLHGHTQTVTHTDTHGHVYTYTHAHTAYTHTHTHTSHCLHNAHECVVMHTPAHSPSSLTTEGPSLLSGHTLSSSVCMPTGGQTFTE